jgi:hypothetical protein
MSEKTSGKLIKDLDCSPGVLDDLIHGFALSANTDNYYLPTYHFFETKAVLELVITRASIGSANQTKPGK